MALILASQPAAAEEPALLADLAVALSASPDPVVVERELIYTIVVTNRGPTHAENVTVIDTLPPSVSLVSVSSARGPCTGTTTVTCVIPTLSGGIFGLVGVEGTATITITVRPLAVGPITNAVSVRSDQLDPDPSNNKASVTTVVDPGVADLEVTKSASPSPVRIGSTLTYTVTVRDRGPDTARDVVLTDALPAGVSFVSATATQGTCEGSSTVRCVLGRLDPGASATVTITASASTLGEVRNVASVTRREPDPVAANDVAEVRTLVASILGVAKCGDLMLPGATVELRSGTALIATTVADASTATYGFAAGPGEYSIRIISGRTVCGDEATLVTDPIEVAPPPPAIDLANHSWPRAYRIDPLATPGIPVAIRQHLTRSGMSAWFVFRVQAGSRVLATLTDVPVDYDLTLYRDIRAAAQRPVATARDLLLLDAQVAGDAFSPDAFSPDAFSPDAFSPDAFSPDAFSPDAFSPDAFSPDAFSPDAFSPDAFSPDAFSPDAFSPDAFSPDAFSPDAFSPDAFSGAQSSSLVAVSARSGTAPESIARNTWEHAGDMYIRIRGRAGAFSLAAPFRLEVTVMPGSCGSVQASTAASTTAIRSAGYRTVILTDPGRMNGSAEAKATMRARLADFAARPEVSGIVVDLGTDARVAALNAQADAQTACPYAKDLVAQAAKDVIDAFRAAPNPIEHVVIVGSDAAVPFFRHPDRAGLANERSYVPPVLDSSASQAALRSGHVLGQDRYGASVVIARGDHVVALPDLAVGRLVETPEEVTGMLDAYLATPGGVVAPVAGRALVTGYDFLSDAADAIRTELQLGLGSGATVDAVIQPIGGRPEDPTAWTADQLRTALFGRRSDIAFLAGHYSAASALAADYRTRLLASEVAASSVDLTNSVVLGAGCHAGYSVVDRDMVSGVTLAPDFAQAFARKRATLIAGTGYQYGDTDLIAYGERIYLEVARQLRTGTGPVQVGKALVAAKRAYLAAIGTERGIDEKTLVETTLFGIPHLALSLPGERRAAPATTSIVTALGTYAQGPGAALGLRHADVSVASSLVARAVPVLDPATGQTAVATYLEGASGVVTAPGEPVLPLEIRNVTADRPLRGVGFRGGTYADTGGVRPLVGAPATELSGARLPFASDVLYPIRPWSIDRTDALFGGATRLDLIPAQWVAAAPGSTTGTLRAFDRMEMRLYYSAHLGRTAGSAPPAILGVMASADGAGRIAFGATVLADPGAGVQEVWVTHTAVGGTEWRSIDLTQDPLDSRRWTGSAALGTARPEDVRFVVQAVSGVGLVAMSTDLGAHHRVTATTAPRPKASAQIALTSAPPSGAYRDAVTVSAQLTVASAPAPAALVSFSLGAQRRLATTDASGIATATMSLSQTPGPYEIVASAAETAERLAASVRRPFTVLKAATALEPSPVEAGTDPVLAVVTLRDASSARRPIRDRAVAFTLAGEGRSMTRVASTDGAGRASFLAPPGWTGSYRLTAAFGATVDASGTPIVLDDDRFLPSGTETTIELGDRAMGGGWIQTANGRGNFELNLTAGSDGTVSGHLRYKHEEAAVDLAATTFSWLIVSGARVEMTGSATVNGVAGHRYHVLAADLPDGDAFDIRIWREASGTFAAPQYRSGGSVVQGSVVAR